MPHNSLIHGGPSNPAAWVASYVVTQLDFQTLDQRQFEAINGDLGGAWAPSSPIIIGGSGLTLTATLTATHADFANGISVSNTATFNGSVVFQGGSVISTLGTKWQFFDEIAIKGGGRIFLDASSELVLHAASLVTADCSFDIGDGGAAKTFALASNMAVTIAGSFALSGGATLSGATPYLVQSGATLKANGGTIEITGGLSTFQVDHGARINKGKLDLNNANQNIDVTDGPVFIVPGISADRTYAIQNTSATTGDELEFYCVNTSNDGIVTDQVGNTLALMRQVTVGKVNYLRARYSGTAWVIAAKSIN